MKNLKQWLLVFMASFMLVGIATGCNNSDTETNGTNTEDNENMDEGTEDGTETEEEGK